MIKHVCIIGAGPGGYVCAIRAAQLGLSVTLVERTNTLGGTCLNVGCIPSKALLHLTHQYTQIAHLADYGITAKELSFDLKKMHAHRLGVIKELNTGISYLLKKNKINHVVGSAQFLSTHKINVTGHGEIEADAFVIATGSCSRTFPNISIDEKDIVTSTGALEFSKPPKSLAVIGGGVIGLELGSVWSRLGTNVSVIEFFDTITPSLDIDLRTELAKELEAQGLSFSFSTAVTHADKKGGLIELTLENQTNGKRSKQNFEKVLISVGRVANTEGLDLSEVGVSTNAQGFIDTNDHMQTTQPHIFAIGDVIGGAMLAHKAEEEGIAVAETLAGQSGHVNYHLIPNVIYTHPEVASVGYTQQQVEELGIPFKVGKIPFSANGRAKACLNTQGFAKVISHVESDEVLGVHIIHEYASMLIAEAAQAMAFKATAEDIARTCHAHPTHNEVLKEAAWASFDKPIQF